MLTLSPQGRAVAAIVLAFLLVTGSLDRIGTTAVAIVDDTQSKDQFVAATIVTLVIALGVLLLAARAASTATEQWAVALAQGARVLAAVGLVITALSLAAALSNEYFGGFHYFGAVLTG